uniref:Uncharacterized protein n=1 Tax=Rhizophora mucronata TaxID=61149 RepID=A0A2P2L118_RHIMU
MIVHIIFSFWLKVAFCCFSDVMDVRPKRHSNMFIRSKRNFISLVPLLYLLNQIPSLFMNRI